MSNALITRRRLMTALAGSSTALMLGACTTPALANPTNIGFDLWSGVQGATFGSAVDKTVGSRRITGPHTWTHPITGEAMVIYIRENRERNGVRVQYFTMRPDGTALAHVFDPVCLTPRV